MTGKFIARPNRFIAEIEIEGQRQRAHVKNTGRLGELLVPDAEVYLEDFDGRMGTRKMRYSLIAVRKGNQIVNIDSQAPNKIAFEALSEGSITLPSFGRVTSIKTEKTYGNSRFDLSIENEQGKKGFIEVKGCTLNDEGTAKFPDAPTERGVKHINELISAHEEGYYAAVLFIIQMKEVHCFMAHEARHPEFAQALRTASARGVEILAYDCEVTEDTITSSLPVPVKL